ncbi:MAG: hypothetical protein CL896_03615 [Dehalococcoidia bacterium]|nr:hypothetical protein [Dehalococcoidia bacterium]
MKKNIERAANRVKEHKVYKKLHENRKKVAYAIFAVTTILLTSYLGIGYFIYLQLAKGSIGDGGQAGNTPANFEIKWDKHEGYNVTSYLMPNYENITIPGGDEGIELSAWWISGDEEKPTIIMCHGLRSSKAADTLLLVAGMLNRNDYNVVMFDYRDHGHSTQEDGMLSLGIREHRDIIAVMEWVNETKDTPHSEIGLYGMSMGGGYVAAAFMTDERFPAVIMESPYADLNMIIEEELELNGFPSWLSKGAIFMAEILTGDELLSMPPLDAVSAANGRPMFVIHGTGDERVGVHHSQMMIERAEKENVDMDSWIIPDLEHVEAPLSHSDEYENRIIEFYEEALT